MVDQQNSSEPDWYEQSVEKTLVTLNTTERGISEQESKKRLANYGFNRLPEPKKTVFFYASCSSFITYSSMYY